MADIEKQMEEMHKFNEKLYRLVEDELSKISDPHIIGGVLAAALQSFWIGIMGAEDTAASLRQVADDVEQNGDKDEKYTVH